MDSKNIAIISLLLSGMMLFLVFLSYVENKRAREAAMTPDKKPCSCSDHNTDTTPNPATTDSANTLTVSNGVIQPMS